MKLRSNWLFRCSVLWSTSDRKQYPSSTPIPSTLITHTDRNEYVQARRHKTKWTIIQFKTQWQSNQFKSIQINSKTGRNKEENDNKYQTIKTDVDGYAISEMWIKQFRLKMSNWDGCWSSKVSALHCRCNSSRVSDVIITHNGPYISAPARISLPPGRTAHVTLP